MKNRVFDYRLITSKLLDNNISNHILLNRTISVLHIGANKINTISILFGNLTSTEKGSNIYNELQSRNQ